jgi:mono/diheme cytochrome c family protein
MMISRFLLVALLPTFAFAADQGELLYTQGRVEGRELMAVLRGSATEVPARLMSCAGCHGQRGEGKTEAGVAVPALQGAFTETELRRAVVDGIGKDGRTLHPVMPSYSLSDKEVSDLVAYLHSLGAGDFGTPGVGPRVIRFGMALGSRKELGDSVREAVAAEFLKINKRGGIYGRQIELVSAASNREMETNVFALIATLDRTSAPLGVPSVGPVSDIAGTPGTYTLLANIKDQIVALAQYALSRQLGRVHWIRSNSPFDREAALAWEDVVKRGIITPCETKTGADALLFTGPRAGLQQLLREDLKSGVPVLTLQLIAGTTVFTWPEDQRRRLMLAYPALLPPDFDMAALDPDGVSPQYGSSRVVAAAAARIAIEALKRSGRDLTRDGFRQSLESLHAFRTGLVPPVTFGPRQYAGVRGAYIVSARANGYERLTDWLNSED